MERFFKTQISQRERSPGYDEQSSVDERLEIVPTVLSDKQELVVGKNVLIYCENDGSRNAIKVENRVQELKDHSILPKEMEAKRNFLLSKKDGGRFIELEARNGQTFFVKFRTLHTGNIREFSGNPETVVTSSCIFGFEGTKAKLEDGSVVPFRNGQLGSTDSSKDTKELQVVGWQIENRISAYELEAIARITSFIRSLESSSTKFNKLILNTPRVEYYLAGLNLYEESSLSLKLLLEWFSLVDRRTERLNKLFSDRVDSRYSVLLKPPLEELRQFIISAVTDHKPVDFNDALELLSQDMLWREALDVRKAVSWNSLVEMAIAIEELRSSFQTNDPGVVVKSPKQENAAYLSRDIAKLMYAKHAEHFNLVNMYPHEQIIVTHDTAARPLLSHVAEPMSISSAKKIIALYRPGKIE